jgi:Putative phage tail protein
MQTIFDLRGAEVTDTPLLVFDCVLPNGQTEHWSTHAVSAGGNAYAARVLQHTIFEIQTASDQGVDGIPRISIVLANADSRFSEIERSAGWKGSRLTVGFLFYDLRNGAPLTDTSVIFQGVCNPPDEIREATFRITATNRMNLQRLLMPQVRIQRRCPWEFPATGDQRTEAVDGGSNGKYSRYYRCGYSAGVDGGTGSLNAGAPFTSCDYTRGDCQARGMFTNFGGIEFVPPGISVRTAGDKASHTSAVSFNTAQYNDFVPMLYGTAWCAPPVVFARNDGNLTRMEVLLGLGEMQGVLTVLVNDVEIPVGVSGTNMTGTGWYNILTLGTRTGAFDANFQDGSGQPAGDPYGSMAYLSVVVPNRLSSGLTLPTVKVLAQGLKLPVYAADGTPQAEQFSNNPAWILLDILRRTGWSNSELDLASFAAAAAYCDEPIQALDIYGNAIALPRFGCNLVLKNRQSAGNVVRGVRTTARMLLTYGPNGVLQARIENAAAVEQPSKPVCSNSTTSLSNGGWPSYEFGDGSSGLSGILRKPSGEPTVRVYSRSIADAPNRFTVEFQDALNEYQQDSYELVDPVDIALCGQEVSITLPASGIPNFDQAGRLLKVNLDKSVRGNTYIEFDTSVKSFGVKPGDLITVTYLKEGFNRQAFRILKIAPGLNNRVSTITAQIHDDAWYSDSNGQSVSASGGRRQGNAGVGIPKPLLGNEVDANGDIEFGVAETAATSSDGVAATGVTVGFVTPAISADTAGPGIPMLNLSPAVATGGSLESGQTLYYAVSGVDAAGNESLLSFIVRAAIADDGSGVTLAGLSFSPGTAGFNVYRGVTPAQLFQIATNQTVAAQFTDTGLPKLPVAPPDPNFDHANFYWRMELQPEIAVTIHSPSSAGNDSLQMTVNRYNGMIARLTRGHGAGQERAIAANTATTLTVRPAWDAEPDATSFLVVAETGWRFGALAASSPVEFQIPNRAGETVHLTGRAANSGDVECAAELSTVTRWLIGGSGTSDTAAPPEPYFGLGAGQSGGTVELSGISFTDLTNTRTATAATLTMRYWDELQGKPALSLSNAVAAGDLLLPLSAAGSALAGGFIQIEAEVIRVEEVQNNGTQYRVTRAMDGSQAAAHAAQATVYQLAGKTVVAPFPPDFFGSPYSGNWSYSVGLPDVRVASAELFLTNQQGNSPVRGICLTNTVDSGLRTLSGGQYSIQVDGFLAVDQSVAPALVVEASHAVRDVFAVLGKVADAPVNLQVNVNGAAYCTLTFASGLTTSTVADGNTLGPLIGGAKVTLSVLSVGQTYPGADLTVLIRL